MKKHTYVEIKLEGDAAAFVDTITVAHGVVSFDINTAHGRVTAAVAEDLADAFHEAYLEATEQMVLKTIDTAASGE